MAELLSILINTENLPCYIHCTDGANNTGLVLMCLRKLQNWAISLILSEFGRYVRDVSEESQFVESFKEEIMIPPAIPRWLWGGQRIPRHPTMRIRDSLLPAPNEAAASSSSSYLFLPRDRVMWLGSSENPARHSLQYFDIFMMKKDLAPPATPSVHSRLADSLALEGTTILPYFRSDHDRGLYSNR
eukprot:TRINITY_DN14921_c0_g2_i2.p1 TRINITY_DN14921_c0_g2~~TRINITY_DN14921_c0_g2_i2.p1  ORF type:complete len:187 (+),score=21.80 TRINITY_DN14921_c0_g2_i2:279-839(+)